MFFNSTDFSVIIERNKRRVSFNETFDQTGACSKLLVLSLAQKCDFGVLSDISGRTDISSCFASCTPICQNCFIPKTSQMHNCMHQIKNCPGTFKQKFDAIRHARHCLYKNLRKVTKKRIYNDPDGPGANETHVFSATKG